MKPSVTLARWWIACIALICLSAPLESWASPSWWNGDWQYRKAITVKLPPAGSSGPASVVVPIRLHVGNFTFFSDLQPSGADLRFIAADGTALNYQIELLDPAGGLLVAWVEIPVTADTTEHPLWMYYGNPKAAAPDATHVYGADQVLVLHFGESHGVPRDATAYRNDAAESTAILGVPGVIGNGASFDGHGLVRIAQHPALQIAEGGAMTFSAWVKVDAESPRAVLFSETQQDRHLEIGLAGLTPYAEVADGRRVSRVESSGSLSTGAWHHVQVSIGNDIAFYIDGALAGGGASGGLPAIAGDVSIGGVGAIGAVSAIGAAGGGGEAALSGELDEVEISKVARSAWWALVSAQSQRTDASLVEYGTDESKGAAGKLTAYFAMMSNLLQQVSLDGLAVIVITTLLGLASAQVFFSKAAMLKRMERDDARFIGEFPERLSREAGAALGVVRAVQEEADKNPEALDSSSLYAMYRSGLSGLTSALAAGTGATTEARLGPEALEAMRAALDGALVEEVDRMNARLVVMTIAIAGAPFLGLLGTVVGVMITFASIAAAGDVNVNTIAPGVAAAMAATVVGLLVAIPSLFGYNWLATHINRRTSAMEVFATQFLSRVALIGLAARQPSAGGRTSPEPSIHAA